MRTIVGIAVLAACGKHPVTPTSPTGMPLTEARDSASYAFRYAAGDTVDPAWQETYHAWLVSALEVQAPGRLTYHKFFNRSHMGDVTGHYQTNGYAEPASFNVYTIWPTDNHEVVHVLSALIGSPPALFNEGLAVAHQTNPSAGDLTPRWSGTPLHDAARAFRRQGKLIGLSGLLTTTEFRRVDPNVTYPEAGSFVRYLLDSHGLAALKRFFHGGSPAESAGSVRQRFADVYGRAVEDAERDWLAMLDRP